MACIITTASLSPLRMGWDMENTGIHMEGSLTPNDLDPIPVGFTSLIISGCIGVDEKRTCNLAQSNFILAHGGWPMK
jgi:hypothetical protein